jgi:hypothetical protein
MRDVIIAIQTAADTMEDVAMVLVVVEDYIMVVEDSMEEVHAMVVTVLVMEAMEQECTD